MSVSQLAFAFVLSVPRNYALKLTSAAAAAPPSASAMRMPWRAARLTAQSPRLGAAALAA
jgi:hypothetical protein